MKKLTVLFLLLALSVSAFAQNYVYSPTPPNLKELSYDDANKAIEAEIDAIKLEKVKKIGPEYITNLVTQLRSGQLNNENKTLAIYFLGELGPTNLDAISFLIENIDFKATRFDPIDKSRMMIERWGEYPAIDALVRIGKPAVQPILDDLPSESSELRRSLLCKVEKIILRFYLAGMPDPPRYW